MWHTIGTIWAFGFAATWIFIWGALTWAILAGEEMENKVGHYLISIALSAIWPLTLPSLGKFMLKKEKEEKEKETNEKA
jgi:hypothetical protein